jgi:nucleotide-binding universal stress UspA family protein
MTWTSAAPRPTRDWRSFVFKKLLVPLDGSETAEAILPIACEVASATNGDLLLVTAVQQVGVWDATLTLQVMEREEALANEYLAGQASKLAESGFTRASTRVTRGDAAEAILSLAADQGAELIAISTHGRSGITRWLFGSVATRILDAASVPVLFLRPKEGEDKGAPGPAIKKILVPLDGSELAMRVLEPVQQFAKAMGASLVLFHAVAPITAYPGFETAQAASIGSVIDELQEQAKAILTQAAEKVRASGVEATMVVTLDLAADGILRAADELGVDLIAIGTHGRSGLGRMVLGSVADGVVRRSTDLPTLVIRPSEALEKS